jgi:hypothetical protein
MEKEFGPQESVEGELQRGRHITAFTAIKQDYGFQIQVAGCVCLRAAHNGSKKVIGIVELDDQVVPVLDARKATTNDISDLSCIVLFENLVGETTIVTGQLFDSACQVFDLIVECMDEPETHEHLYTPTEHHLVGESAD